MERGAALEVQFSHHECQRGHLLCTQHRLRSKPEPAGMERDVGLHAERHSGRPVDQAGIDKRKNSPRNTHTPENKSGIAMPRASKLASESLRVPER